MDEQIKHAEKYSHKYRKQIILFDVST